LTSGAVDDDVVELRVVAARHLFSSEESSLLP